jgi:hypothetical protein
VTLQCFLGSDYCGTKRGVGEKRYLGLPPACEAYC